jgi:pantothenate kinase
VGKEKITFALDILSNYKTKSLFMTYDGFLGAIGAFL